MSAREFNILPLRCADSVKPAFSKRRSDTGSARVRSYVSELLAFHFESPTKAFMFSGSRCGDPVCFSGSPQAARQHFDLSETTTCN